MPKLPDNTTIPGMFYLRNLYQHWLLPALTAWVIGVPLNSLAVADTIDFSALCIKIRRKILG